MRGEEYLSCCWPGLSRLWFRGDTSSLAAAVGFAFALNFAILLAYGWPISLNTVSLVLLWSVLAGIWLASAWRAWHDLSAQRGMKPSAEAEGLLIRAQTEYLKGNWFEAEGLANELIADYPSDVEGQLLLASIHRRMNRWQDSTARLKNAARLPQAAKWSMEIAAETLLLQTFFSEQQEQPDAEGAEHDPPAQTARAA